MNATGFKNLFRIERQRRRTEDDGRYLTIQYFPVIALLFFVKVLSVSNIQAIFNPISARVVPWLFIPSWRTLIRTRFH